MTKLQKFRGFLEERGLVDQFENAAGTSIKDVVDVYSACDFISGGIPDWSVTDEGFDFWVDTNTEWFNILEGTNDVPDTVEDCYKSVEDCYKSVEDCYKSVEEPMIILADNFALSTYDNKGRRIDVNQENYNGVKFKITIETIN